MAEEKISSNRSLKKFLKENIISVVFLGFLSASYLFWFLYHNFIEKVNDFDMANGLIYLLISVIAGVIVDIAVNPKDYGIEKKNK